MNLFFAEVIFAYTTKRAFKVVGKILERSAGFNTHIRCAFLFVIDPSANFTYIFFHNVHLRYEQYTTKISYFNERSVNYSQID